MTPEAGKSYDVSARVRVEHTHTDNGGMSWALIRLGDGWRYTTVPTQEITWTEVEPEYVVGALYEDADGNVWRREPLDSPDDKERWSEARNGGYCEHEEQPKSPLTRLYREGEVPS